MMADSKNNHDVIVIGGGACGLMAALELTKTGKKVIILEATNRLGGRIFSLHDDRSEMPIELGAEFIHGELELTHMLVKKAKGALNEVQGELWHYRESKIERQEEFLEDYSAVKKKYNELDHDVPIAFFLDQCLADEKYKYARESIKDYAEGYYAADISKSSTAALIQEWEKNDPSQYRIEQGYGLLIDYFRFELEKTGCVIKLQSPVSDINWKKDHVQVKTNNDLIIGHKTLITVSLGVLQSDQLIFNPAIDEKINAAKSLGYGGAHKLILGFEKSFWKEHKGQDLSKMSFLFSEESIPTWWTPYPAHVPIITGWVGGPRAKKIQHYPEKKIIEEGIKSLGNIFDMDIDYLYSQLQKSWIKNWLTDPYYYGAYSFEVVDGEKYKSILSRPIDNTLFFAGEALPEKSETGTVEAALESGRNMAHIIIASF